MRRYRDKVYRLSYKILRNEDDAAEALQDAFLSALSRAQELQGRIHVLDLALPRRDQRQPDEVPQARATTTSRSSSRRATSEDAEPHADPGLVAAAARTSCSTPRRVEVMEEGMRRLPEDLRTVFMLRDIEELSNAEVAEMLDLTVAAVKSRLHRARICAARPAQPLLHRTG